MDELELLENGLIIIKQLMVISAAKLKRYDDIWKLIQEDAKNDGEFSSLFNSVYEKGGIETPTPFWIC